MNQREERIRERAEQLWIEAGRPSGRDDEFWHQAEAEIAADQRPDPPPARGGTATR